MKKLSPKREKFAQLMASGKKQLHAYREAFEVSKSKDKTVQAAASRLMKNKAVKARIKEIMKPGIKKAQYGLKQHLARLEFLSLSAVKARQFGPAVSAEISRGKVIGLYVEKIDLSNRDGTLNPKRIEIVAPSIQKVVKKG